MPKCETCGHDAQEIQASMEKRISEQGARIKEQKAMLDQATTKAAELEARVKELAAREESVALREAETAGGWSMDDRGRKLARWAYEDAHESVAPEERPSFAEWLKSDAARSDTILAGYRRDEGATGVAPSTGKAPAAPGASAKPPTPPPNGSTAPPVRRTLDQINAEAKAVMASSLSTSEKAAKIAELKAQRDQAAKGGAPA